MSYHYDSSYNRLVMVELLPSMKICALAETTNAAVKKTSTHPTDNDHPSCAKLPM